MPPVANLKWLSWMIVLSLIGFMSVIRFVGLESAPPGFFMDEALIATHVICLSQAGQDADGRKWPLFSDSGGGGYASPTHLYPAAVWVRLFGYSIAAFRAYAALIMTLAIVGLFFLARLLMDNRGATFVALAACLSPWMFQFSRMAFDDPPTFLLGLCWGMYFFLRSAAWRDAMLAALFMSIAAYAYPSGRIVLPPLCLLLIWLKTRRERVAAKYLFVFVASGTLLCLPLLMRTLSGKLMTRYQAVGIFTDAYRQQQGIGGAELGLVFIKNFLLHFSPNYLFFHGDENLRHSSQFSGELSWLDLLALLAGVAWFLARLKKARWVPVHPIMIFCAGGFLLGIVPAALTWEGLPHSLRSAACWPFAAVLTGFVMWTLESQWRGALTLFAGVGLAYAIGFTFYFFTIYPSAARPFFQAPVEAAARRAQFTGDWMPFVQAVRDTDYDPRAARYFLIVYGEQDCERTQPG